MLPNQKMRPRAARLAMAMVALASVVLTGCGRVPGMPTTGIGRAGHVATIMAGGQARKLGFDPRLEFQDPFGTQSRF